MQIDYDKRLAQSQNQSAQQNIHVTLPTTHAQPR